MYPYEFKLPARYAHDDIVGADAIGKSFESSSHLNVLEDIGGGLCVGCFVGLGVGCFVGDGVGSGVVGLTEG